MRTITLIYDGTFNTYRWLKTMMSARKEFYKRGFNIEYASILDYIPYPRSSYNPFEKILLKWDTTFKYDIVFLAFHHSQSIIGLNADARIEFVKKLRERSNLLCWMDTADSTGTCLFDVLPYVDLYFKKQLLKNVDLYTREFYCGRLYADYYHRTLSLNDEILNATRYAVAKKSELKKLRVSWNVAFYDRMGGRTWIYKHPYAMASPRIFTNEIKTIDVHFGGSNSSVYGNVVGYQRKKMLELIDSLGDISHPDVYKKVSREEYMEELRHSKSIASPFGWGECCLRDYEAFINGAILIKPSMNHCNTYPDLYQDYKTYVPIDWDFSNFNLIVHEIKAGKYDDVARKGQQLYIKYRLGPNAMALFADHIIQQLRA